jgi:aldehyde:ferredoxin oxidoreductase
MTSSLQELTFSKEDIMSFLHVTMSDGKVIAQPFPKDELVGGRALIDYLMTEHGSATAHPLSEESLFIVAPGLLAGTSAPMAGRLSVGGKSPLTGGIKEANSGGTVAGKLGRCGIRGIMVGGRAKEWQILKVTPRGASLDPGGDIAGLMNYAACDKLRDRYGDKVGIAITGPAGEMGLANSTVAVTDIDGRPCRHCARGGMGALMGAKRLKAIVVDDSGGNLRMPTNEEAFSAAVKAAVGAIKSSPWTEPMHKFGTPVFTEMGHGRGSLPTLNYRMGSFEKVQNLGVAKYLEYVKSRGGSMGHSCMAGCVVQCSPIWHDTSGQFLTAAFEYETICLLGSNIGIDDLDAVARMDRKCDELGLDTIETGSAIGILSEVGLFSFGDSKRAEALIDEIGKATPMGRILGSGVATTAKVFGIERVPAVKGQAIPGHAARALKGFGVTYATSPQGADHSAGIVHSENELDSVGKVDASREVQITTAALDSAGFCMFTNFFSPHGFHPIVPLINAFYGVNWTDKDYLELGREALRRERSFNIRAGIGPEQDRLPDWERTEPLPPTGHVFDVSHEEIERFFDF